MFNIKNNNEPYRIPCLSTHSIIPQHAISVGGGMRHLRKRLTGLRWNNKGGREERKIDASNV